MSKKIIAPIDLAKAIICTQAAIADGISKNPALVIGCDKGDLDYNVWAPVVNAMLLVSATTAEAWALDKINDAIQARISN
jgi:hypothetical protein